MIDVQYRARGFRTFTRFLDRGWRGIRNGFRRDMRAANKLVRNDLKSRIRGALRRRTGRMLRNVRSRVKIQRGGRRVIGITAIRRQAFYFRFHELGATGAGRGRRIDFRPLNLMEKTVIANEKHLLRILGRGGRVLFR